MSVAMRYKTNPEDAKAMVNQAFLKIMTNIQKYTFDGPFEAWIRRIMINTLIDDFRKIQKERDRIEHIDFSETNGNSYGFNFNEAEQIFSVGELEAMIHQLPNMTRNVFNLFAIDGYKHKEIADLFGISIGTSKWHLANARKKLLQMLQEMTDYTFLPIKKEYNEK